MKFVKVKELPKKAKKKRVMLFLEEFVASNIKIAKVEFNESDYCSPSSCQSAFRKSALTGGYPVEVKTVDKVVYLIRTDM